MSSGSAVLPSSRGAGVGQRLARGVARTLFRPRFLGSWRMPVTGPVILAVNHSHMLDGPALMAASPRPVHFLIKSELFSGWSGRFLEGFGQVPVHRDSADRAAVNTAVGILEDGGVLGIFPEGTRGEGDFASIRAGLAYFAVRCGAPVVPVAVLGGTESTGRLIPALPPLRSRIDVVIGDPFVVDAGSDGRRTRQALDGATLDIQHRLTAHLETARRLTGRS